MSTSAKIVFLAAALSASPVLADDVPAGSDTPTESTFRRQGALLDRSPQRRSNMLSLFLGIPYGGYYFYGFPFGVGGRFMIPILHDGFIPAINDSFSIEFGADLYGVAGSRFYPVLGIPVELMWAFHFTKNFAAYAKVGAVLEINFVPYVCGGGILCRGVVSASPIGNIGLIYKFTEKISFRAEAGYPWIKVGFGFDM